MFSVMISSTSMAELNNYIKHSDTFGSSIMSDQEDKQQQGSLLPPSQHQRMFSSWIFKKVQTLHPTLEQPTHVI